MKVCPKCGHREHLNWRNSRFDYNAEYISLEEASQELKQKLPSPTSFFTTEHHVIYRRGTDGRYVYRVPLEDYKVPRERKKHFASLHPKQEKLSVEAEGRKRT